MNAVATQTRSDANTLSAIQDDLSANIYVEAGAGTGKTYSLVQRIVALLKSGVAIDEIIAITFTRAAASELRSRIRGELEILRADDAHDTNVKTALEGIDTAAFQTIDSLVYSLLREFPLEAGLPPAIEVQDGFAEIQMFRERWRQWSLEKLENEKEEDFAKTLSMAIRLNLSSPFETVSELAKSMSEKHAELRTAIFAPPERIGIETIQNLEPIIEDLIDQIHRCSDSGDSLYEKIEESIDWYSRSVAGRVIETEDDADDILTTWPSVTATGGRMSSWGGREGKAEAADALQSLIDAIKTARSAAREAVTGKLIDYAAEFVETIVQERRRAGTVTYYDAVTWLIDMLESNSAIRRRIQERYRRLLVDEFQDTDPNQVRLVRLLTIPPGEDHIAPGSLFVVGDPKQSIYRFRGAQVRVSQGVKTDIVNDNAGGQHLALRENRRSTTAIINWVNHVFGNWMREEEGQADWIPLDVAEDTAESDDFGRVYRFGEAIDVKNVGEVREADAKRVAEIARAVCAGKLTVRDRHDGSKRPSRPGDLTILTRARTSWDLYTKELDELHLPYTAEIGGAEVLDTQEFRDLLNCLTAIDDPSDQPATVGALKSTYFGCSDVDLYCWAKAGGKFACTTEFPDDPQASAVRDAMEVLRRYNELRDELQPPVLIEQFIRERQARELMFLEEDPAPGLRRLDLSVELARLFTEEGAASLRECLIRFAQMRESDEAIREQPALEFDEGKIRFMTMHASKGLEFPIAILADLCGTGNPDTPQLLTDWDSGLDDTERIGVRLGGNKNDGYFQTGNYETILNQNSTDENLEKTRLHYVACTRARDYLFVSRFRKEKDTSTVAGRIDEYVGGDNPALWSPTPAEWQTIRYEPKTAPEIAEEIRFAQDRKTWMREHQTVMAAASIRQWLSPSNLKGSTDSDAGLEIEEKPDDTLISDSEDFTGRGRAATKIGSAVHAAIQRSLEIPNVDIAQIARSEAEKHGVTENVEEIERLTTATLETPLLKHAASLNRENIWIETPVAVPINTTEGTTKTIEGRVDLIYRRESGTLGIADFKTDRTFNRSISEMAGPYIPQLGAYAYAVQKATGIPVTEASILFSRIAADRPDEGQYQLPDVQSAIELALKLASTQ